MQFLCFLFPFFSIYKIYLCQTCKKHTIIASYENAFARISKRVAFSVIVN